jgi:hypothetical protein
MRKKPPINTNKHEFKKHPIRENSCPFVVRKAQGDQP